MSHLHMHATESCHSPHSFSQLNKSNNALLRRFFTRCCMILISLPDVVCHRSSLSSSSPVSADSPNRFFYIDIFSFVDGSVRPQVRRGCSLQWLMQPLPFWHGRWTTSMALCFGRADGLHQCRRVLRRLCCHRLRSMEHLYHVPSRPTATLPPRELQSLSYHPITYSAQTYGRAAL